MILFGNWKHTQSRGFLLLQDASVASPECAKKQATHPSPTALVQSPPWWETALLLCGFRKRERVGWSSGWTQEFPAGGPWPLTRSHWGQSLSIGTGCPALCLLSLSGIRNLFLVHPLATHSRCRNQNQNSCRKGEKSHVFFKTFLLC